MKTFNKEQKYAINTNSNNHAVIAGAGTGKTTVLIERIKEILKVSDPSEILAITFTKKASNEMKERLSNDKVLLSTFDAFCYNLLPNKDFVITNEFDNFSKRELLEFSLYDANYRLGIKPKNYDLFTRYKLDNNIKDFNDIEYEALMIIRNNNINYNYILIDEFQDTNNLQYEIFLALLNNNTKTFIVGDPDQSIYKFRGANNKLISKYIDDFNADVTLLTINYRSTKAIVYSANKLISNNTKRIEKTLISNNENYGQFHKLLFNNADLEYNYIIDFCSKTNTNNNSIAILFRNHDQGYLYKKYFYNKYNNVHVLTIHESKGLEFDIVFIIGINKGVLPSNRVKNILFIEEERRLFFVAITRAKKELYVCINNKQSKFIKELSINRKKVLNETTKIRKI